MSIPEPEEVYARVKPCEKFIALDDLDSFYACLEERSGLRWKHRDVVMFDDEGNMVRLLAYLVAGDSVLSVLAFYSVGDDASPVYSGFDVDLSPLDDVRRVLGEV